MMTTCLAPVVNALQKLHETWKTLASTLPSVRAKEGEAAATLLSSHLSGGETNPPEPDTYLKESNAVLLPLTVVTQVVQYLDYCDENQLRHQDVLKSARTAGGIQGCCAGLLSALVIAGSDGEEDVGRVGGPGW